MATVLIVDAQPLLRQDIVLRVVMLEEYARRMILAEEHHAGEADKDAVQAGRFGGLGVGPITARPEEIDFD